MKKLLLTMLAILPLATWASAGNVKIAWYYPTAEEVNIVGYKLYYGQVSDESTVQPPGVYTNVVEGILPASREWTVFDLAPGTYYFRATAYNAELESEFSNEAEVLVGLVKVIIQSVTVEYPQ